MKLMEKVYNALEVGPSTSNELSLELGLNVKTISATLHDLESCGMVKHEGTIRENKVGRISFIWSKA